MALLIFHYGVNMKNIEIRMIFKVIPVPIFWTEKFLEDWSGGLSAGIFCIIRPKYRDRKDEGIVTHELRHCKQFYSRFLFFSFMYLFNWKYRLNAEIEAYAEQIETYKKDPINVTWVINVLETKYKIPSGNRELIKQKLKDKCPSIKLVID